MKSFSYEVIKYIVGFVGALLATLAAYIVAVGGFIDNTSLLALLLLVLALIQLLIQVIFFLHLGEEQKPRWQKLSFIFTSMMLVVVVVGSLWIMKNLDYRMHMNKEQIEAKMHKEGDKGF